MLPYLIRCLCAAVFRFVVSFHLCLSLRFSSFLSHYNFLFPLVPSSGNSLNQFFKSRSPKLRLTPFNKVVVTRCENRCQPIEATSQIMTDMLREVSSSIDNLAMGRIPHYLIPLSLVQNILTSATAGPASPIQTQLAFFLGSAIPSYVDPEAGDLAFLLSLPIIDSNIIYRLKDVVNVGFSEGNTYVKIHTPEVVAYHDNNEQLYLAPNLKMCTLTKDIHFLCPSKPFVHDNTEGICGLESIRPNTSCDTTFSS